MKSNEKFTQLAELAIERASRAARDLGHDFVGTEHLLLGILEESGGLGARILRGQGLEEAALRRCLVRLNGMGAAGTETAPMSGHARQAVDQAGREGNYLESSGSSMIAYAMLKGARLHVLPESFAALGRKTFDGIVNTCLNFDDGQINLDHICLVAGLGPENNRRRDGTYAYYISEPVVKNDAKGVAPFILCYTEVKRLSPAS